MYEYCDGCDFYDIGDTCEECKRRRHKSRIVVTDCDFDDDRGYDEEPY